MFLITHNCRRQETTPGNDVWLLTSVLRDVALCFIAQTSSNAGWIIRQVKTLLMLI